MSKEMRKRLTEARACGGVLYEDLTTERTAFDPFSRNADESLGDKYVDVMAHPAYDDFTYQDLLDDGLI